MNELFINPMYEGKKLEDALRKAKISKDCSKEKQIKDQLLRHYIQYGEYFKMSDHPDPGMAIRLLEKAIKYIPNHSIACYRLGHLYYREERYEEAALYFKKALESYEPKYLTDTQRFVAQMFRSNCGMLISKQAVLGIQKIEDDSLDLDEEWINRYRDEIFVTNEETLNLLYYRKITRNSEETTISREHIFELLDQNLFDSVILTIDGDGFSIKLGIEIAKLHLTAFHIIYTIFMADDFISNDKILEMITGRESVEVEEDTIRQSINRLKDYIPFWEDIIDTKRVGRKNARRLNPKFNYIILCQVGRFLPGEI